MKKNTVDFSDKPKLDYFNSIFIFRTFRLGGFAPPIPNTHISLYFIIVLHYSNNNELVLKMMECQHFRTIHSTISK